MNAGGIFPCSAVNALQYVGRVVKDYSQASGTSRESCFRWLRVFIMIYIYTDDPCFYLLFAITGSDRDVHFKSLLGSKASIDPERSPCQKRRL